MAEYINRDDILDLSYCPTSLTWDNPLAEQKSVVDVDDINSIPTADVVEVVRCKDCEFYEPHGNGRGGICRYSKFTSRIRLSTDFCSDGKRRDK